MCCYLWFWFKHLAEPHQQCLVLASFLFTLQAFFAEHPEYAENDFFITGESYAGHYIPAFAARVHRGNKAKEGTHINLKVCSIDMWAILSYV